MSEDAPRAQDNSRDHEIIRGMADQPVPPKDELLSSFATKRQALQERVEELDAQYGGTMDATQIRERDNARKAARAELDDLNQVWSKIGGEELDAARQSAEDLNFRSDATDHVRATAGVRQAEDTVYENFVREHEAAHNAQLQSLETPEVAANDLSTVKPGDIVRSSKTTDDGYYTPGEFTVQAVRRNESTGQLELHVTDINSKEDGPTNSYILTQEDVVGVSEAVQQEAKVTRIDIAENEPEPDQEVALKIERNDPEPAIDQEPVLEPQLEEDVPARKQEMTADEIRQKRADMVKGGESALDVGNMSDEEIENFEFTEKPEDEKASAGADDEKEPAPEQEPAEQKEKKDGDQESSKEEQTKKNVLSAELAAQLDELIENDKKAEKSVLSPEMAAALKALVDSSAETKGGVLSDDMKEKIDKLAAEKDGQAEAEAAAEAERQKAADREARFAETQEFVDGSEFGRTLKEKFAAYGVAKADLETKGRFGRRKREIALQKAETELAQAKLAYTKRLTELRTADGLYEGDIEARKQARSDDFFNEFRKLDRESRKATREERERRGESKWHKAKVTVGKFLNGGKGKGWLRNGGIGAAAGVGFGFAAGIPVTLLAGASLSYANYEASKSAALQDSLENYKEETMTDEEYAAYRKAMDRSDATKDQKAERLAGEFFGRSRQEGDKELAAAKSKAKGNAKKFGIGFAAGAAAGNLVGGLSGSEVGATDGAGDGSGVESGGEESGPDRAEGGEQGSGADQAGVEPAETNEFEFPSDASTIHDGEGWYSQLEDMGFSESQARELFGDSDFMDKLVDQGAAYVDNSDVIGGYGINMPVGGELSPEVMETIRQAAEAKGFIN